jgi:hypothetical protein
MRWVRSMGINIPIGYVTIAKTLPITKEMVEDIMVGAMEGGINHWGFVSAKTKRSKPSEIPTSTWCSSILLEGGEVYIKDREDDDIELFMLTLENLIQGYQMYINKHYSYEVEDMDVDSFDSIIQYALFGEIVYG